MKLLARLSMLDVLSCLPQHSKDLSISDVPCCSHQNFNDLTEDTCHPRPWLCILQRYSWFNISIR